MSNVTTFHDAEMQRIKQIAESKADRPVLMININCYTAAADFPSGGLYKQYMAILADRVPAVGGKILWRYPVSGQVTGDQKAQEILAAWYPTHQAFLDLGNGSESAEIFRLRGLAVESAVIHRIVEGVASIPE